MCRPVRFEFDDGWPIPKIKEAWAILETPRNKVIQEIEYILSSYLSPYCHRSFSHLFFCLQMFAKLDNPDLSSSF